MRLIYVSRAPDGPGPYARFFVDQTGRRVNGSEHLYSLYNLCLLRVYVPPCVLKRGSSGVCSLWPVAEPSQNKRRRARNLIGR